MLFGARKLKLVVFGLLSVVLNGCVNSFDQPSSLLDRKMESLPSHASEPTRTLESDNLPDNTSFYGIESIGTDKLTAPVVKLRKINGREAADIKINLLDVSVASAAKAILSDALSMNYSVDTRVQGNVTIQTTRAVGKAELMRLFQSALRGINAAIIPDGESVRIVPSDDVARLAPQLDDGTEGNLVAGPRAKILPLRHVSVSEISEVIAPLVPSGMVIKADRRRNALVLNGSQQEIESIREVVSVFDVDWMRGMSFALVPVRSPAPAAIVSDLNEIFDTRNGPLRDILRFVPNKRLKSVLVISSRAKYLREAKDWIRKLDVLAEGNEQGLHVYRVQNRTAAELAGVLQSVLAAGGNASQGGDLGGRQVAPKLELNEQASQNGETITSGPETPQTGLGTDEEIRRELAASTFEATVTSDSGRNTVRVVADDANNSLLIFATPGEFERIKSVLGEIDSQPNQVLLEAVIAEVSLDDETKFGVRWMIGNDKNSGTFSDLLSGAVASSFPGFSYFMKANDIGFTLNALASVTDVRVLSSPSLLVLDNKAATLQVGDQVPIVSQQAKGTSTSDAPIINAVEMKDTGVILNVTPRVNDSGRVILDIEQEVSSVVKTTTSGIDSPTIRQRKIKTSVVLTDGEAMALGGLIQEKETAGQSKVPVLGDVPIIKNAFRHKTSGIARTELIIFIRPRVVRNMEEARDITEEFRTQLDIQAPRVRRGEPSPGEELVRILN